MMNAAADNVAGYFFILNHSMDVTTVTASILLIFGVNCVPESGAAVSVFPFAQMPPAVQNGKSNL